MNNGSYRRMRVRVRGAVQGVGFRPFIYRLATALDLTGWVNNSSQGVLIEAEGLPEHLEDFLSRIERESPPLALIHTLESSFLVPVGYQGFEIQHSDASGEKTTLVLPDAATCPDCLREVFDPADRRYRYPFTNCTNCGPRFSIIEALPYDRPLTTMRHFKMCDQCQAEYENPLDRRFHAQPNACPTCGPQLALWDRTGANLATQDDALLATVDAIRQGKIVAVKGLGGFHLMVDARSEVAVQRLRERKQREEKPFALMYPSLEIAEAHCEVSDLEAQLLRSPQAPIVLLQRKNDSVNIASAVAPRNPYLGIMLPYTPLHHLLMAELGFPVVATSGNLSDEPICTDEHEAIQRLGDIADLFLVHDRPIARPVDDAIIRDMAGRELIIRRARGYAPLPIHVEESLPPILAVGAHLKNTIATSVGQEIFISQHIGDLETTQAFDSFQKTIESFKTLYEFQPATVAHDAHPDYLSTQFARTLDLPQVAVQHHYAHVLACMTENQLEAPVLGVSWDGTGYGLDGTIWGGEFLRVDETSFERGAYLRTFPLPGGEKAVKEPRRSAIGLLYALFGDNLFDMPELPPLQAFTAQELAILQAMLNKGLNAPLTSSAGRLFDAVASLVGLRQYSHYEGQAAMELEFAVDPAAGDVCYDFELTAVEHDGNSGTAISIDWGPMVKDILADLDRKVPTGTIAAKFHHTLVEIIVAVASRLNETNVVLTGGCFQNKYLTERAIKRLQEEGFHPYWPQRIPPNDGGIALGQIVAASREQLRERPKE